MLPNHLRGVPGEAVHGVLTARCPSYAVVANIKEDTEIRRNSLPLQDVSPASSTEIA